MVPSASMKKAPNKVKQPFLVKRKENSEQGIGTLINSKHTIPLLSTGTALINGEMKGSFTKPEGRNKTQILTTAPLYSAF